MPNPGDKFQLGPYDTLTVRATSPELLELDAEWRSSPGAPPKHFHPDQDEHFEIHEGEMSVDFDDGEIRTFGPGETIDVPRGQVHAMWNGGDVPARATWQVRPALRTEDFMAEMTANGRGANQPR